MTAAVATLIALLVARPLLGGSDQAFQFIQEFSGFFTPGITVIFLLGLFWKKATEAGAIAAAVGSVALSYIFKVAMPDFPFMNRMGLVFLITLGLAVAISLLLGTGGGGSAIVLEFILQMGVGALMGAGLGKLAVLSAAAWILGVPTWMTEAGWTIAIVVAIAAIVIVAVAVTLLMRYN